MATEQVGESRDVGPLLYGERQVLEKIWAGAPLAAAGQAIPAHQPTVGLQVGGVPRRRQRKTSDAGRRAASSRRVASTHRLVFSDIDDQVLPYRREPARERGDAAGLLTPTVMR